MTGPIQTKLFGPVEIDQFGAGNGGTMTVPMLGGEAMIEFIDVGPGDASDIDAALAAFAALGPDDKAAAAPRVFTNYQNYMEAAWVREEDAERLAAIKEPDDVWAFVRPHYIQIAREDGTLYVALACHCDWEIEHGLQLIYRDGHDLVRVSAVDGNMTGPSD